MLSHVAWLCRRAGVVVLAVVLACAGAGAQPAWNGNKTVIINPNNSQPILGDPSNPGYVTCVSGCSSSSGSVTYPAPATGSIGSSSATIVTTPGAQFTRICDTSPAGSGNLWLNPNGSAAVAQAGDEAFAGGAPCVVYGGPVVNTNGNIITAISDNGTVTYSVTVGN